MSARFSKFKHQINICWFRVCMKGEKLHRLLFLITVALVSTNQRRFPSFFSLGGAINLDFQTESVLSSWSPSLHLWLTFSDLNQPRKTASSSAWSQTAFSLQGRVTAGQTTRRFKDSAGPISAEEPDADRLWQKSDFGAICCCRAKLPFKAAAVSGQVMPPFCFPREHNSLINEEKWKTDEKQSSIFFLEQSVKNLSSNFYLYNTNFLKCLPIKIQMQCLHRRSKGIVILFKDGHSFQHNGEGKWFFRLLVCRQEQQQYGFTYLGIVGDIMLGQGLWSVHPCFIWNDKTILVRKERINQRAPHQARAQASILHSDANTPLNTQFWSYKINKIYTRSPGSVVPLLLLNT